MNPRCWISAHNLDPSKCDGRLDPAHFIPQRLIRAEHLEEYLEDDRNIRTICRKHHDAFDKGHIKVLWGDLPRSVYDFAHQLGFYYTERGWRKEA